MFPVLWVRGELLVDGGSWELALSPRWGSGDATNTPWGRGWGFWCCGVSLHPSCCILSIAPPWNWGSSPHPLPEGSVLALPSALSPALAGECGELRSCEMCTASAPSHNGTACTWLGCGTPEEPGEGLGWVGTQRGPRQPSPCPWMSCFHGPGPPQLFLKLLPGALPWVGAALSPHSQALSWVPTPGHETSSSQTLLIPIPGPKHPWPQWFGTLGQTLLPVPAESGSCVQRGAAVRENCALFNSSVLCRGNPRTPKPAHTLRPWGQRCCCGAGAVGMKCHRWDRAAGRRAV